LLLLVGWFGVVSNLWSAGAGVGVWCGGCDGFFVVGGCGFDPVVGGFVVFVRGGGVGGGG